MKKTILILILAITCIYGRAQTVSMDFSRTDCNGTDHQLYTELNEGKVVVLEFIMLGCASCIIASQHITDLIQPFELTHPGRTKQYMFGYIKNYTCAQLSSWQTDNGIGGTVFEDGSSQVGYYGGMGMPTIVVTATNNHTVLYKKLGFEPADTTQIQAAIQAGLQYNPQGIGDNGPSSRMKIFPSTFTSNLTIEFATPSSGTVYLYDVTGNEAARQYYSNADRVTMDGLDLRPGLYFVMVRSDQGSIETGKVIRK